MPKASIMSDESSRVEEKISALKCNIYKLQSTNLKFYKHRPPLRTINPLKE